MKKTVHAYKSSNWLKMTLYIYMCVLCLWNLQIEDVYFKWLFGILERVILWWYIYLSLICYSFLWYTLLPDKFSNKFNVQLTTDSWYLKLSAVGHCHALSNVTPVTKSFIKKRSKHNTQKSQSWVKIVKLSIKKLLVFFFARQGLSDSLFELIWYGHDNPWLAKKKY